MRWSSGISTVLAIGTAWFMFAAWPDRAPMVFGFGLSLCAWPLARAWRASRGTALRAVVVWGAVAVVLAIISQAVATREPMAGGRPVSGHLTYLATLATIAALISVLGARKPGGGAWAILMALLLVIFLIPWLEGGLGRDPNRLSRLRLDQPWSFFYLLLVVTGVTNYLPTRFRMSAILLAVGFAFEYAALTSPDKRLESRARDWSAMPIGLLVAIFVADLRQIGTAKPKSRLEAIWFWFRDHWGVVWALRVQERFNTSAELQRWPLRLSWHGVVTPGEVTLKDLETAEATLISLLRRFAEPARIEEAVADFKG